MANRFEIKIIKIFFKKLHFRNSRKIVFRIINLVLLFVFLEAIPINIPHVFGLVTLGISSVLKHPMNTVFVLKYVIKIWEI